MREERSLTSCSLTECETLVDILCWRALHQPDRQAYVYLIDGEREEIGITYRELDEQARSIAATLQKYTHPGARALLLYQPGLHYIAAFFGCLYAGIIAVPAYPPTSDRLLPRLQAIAADAQATVLLTTSTMVSRMQRSFEHLPELKNMHWVATDTCEADQEGLWRRQTLTPETLTFLQYTSGSTGNPKGVMVSHGNLMHNSAMMRERWAQSPESVGISWLPMFHDMGLIAGILQPLYVGFPAILMAPVAFIQHPWRWLHAISRYRGTVSWAPNFAYEICIQRITDEERQQLDLSSWCVAGNGAEPIRFETIERFTEVFLPCGFRREAMTPGYGLAEGTLMVSSSAATVMPMVSHLDKSAMEEHLVVERQTSSMQSQTCIGCGTVAADQRVVIVHPDTQTVCAPNEIGEIWVTGPSVACGYWRHPKETAQTFQARLAPTGDGPFLRTGDLGFLHKNEVFVTGRLKDIIIIHGRNHYPQDIELTVERCSPSLRSGCGMAFAIEVENEERLVVVQEVNRHYQHDEEIFNLIRQAVAEQHEIQVYAITLIQPGSIFKTSSGKIQRRAGRDAFLSNRLHVIASSIIENEYISSPAHAINRTLLSAMSPHDRKLYIQAHLFARICSLVHRTIKQQDPQMPISAYGLDSLQATELVGQLEEDLQVKISFVELLQGITVDGLTTTILEQITAPVFSKPAHQNHEDSTYPLSFAQEQLWVLYQIEPQSSAYNLPVALHIQGKLHLHALEQSIHALALRHEVLRTSLQMRDEQVVQHIHAMPTSQLVLIDAKCLSNPASNLAEMKRQAQYEASQPFDLLKDALIRIRLFLVQEDEQLLLITMHHTISDGWSTRLLLQELSLLYNAFCTEQPATLPIQTTRYVDYVYWQRNAFSTSVPSQEISYWKEQLNAQTTLDLPTDRLRPPVQRYQGATLRFAIPIELKESYQELCRQEGVTLFMAMLAAFQLLLSRYTGQEDIFVGTVTANRANNDRKNIMGFLVNTLVMRTRVSEYSNFRDLLQQVRQICLDAYAHQNLPFAKLVEELKPERDLSRNPLFQVAFTWQPDIFAGLSMPDLCLEPFEIDSSASKFDLTMDITDSKNGLKGTIEYNKDLFEEATIMRLIRCFQQMLQELIINPERPFYQISLLSSTERQLVLQEWNATRTDASWQGATSLIQRLDAQARQTPDTIALLAEEGQLSYQRLHHDAHRLAHSLLACGVGPDVPVALLLDRSLPLSGCLLAILKAQGIYFPLDPTLPPARLATMMRVAQPPALLTCAHFSPLAHQLLATLPDPASCRLLVLEDLLLPSSWLADPLPEPGEADLGAYLLFTSGSTGVPKGVLTAQRAICNRLGWMQRQFLLGPGDRVLQKTPSSFDVSVWELLWPLGAGATLVLARVGGQRDSAYLRDCIQQQAITLLHFVPSLLQVWVEEEQIEACRSVRDLICSGEALSVPLARRLAQRLPTCRLWNLYGPTEAAIDVSCWPCLPVPQEPGAILPIGRPIANIQLYVLDPQRQPVPIGVAGELWIGGIGLARGYLGQPEVTAQSFQPHPFSEQPGERLYRTGDRACWRADGTLAYLGRLDGQVKLRGNRIELGEIESVVGAHAGIEQCVVVLHPDLVGGPGLVAHLVRAAQQPPVTEEELRQVLRGALPDYMVPGVWQWWEQFPLSQSGKLDRRALMQAPLPQRAAQLPAAAERLLTEQERILRQIWGEMLGREEIGLDEDFFAVGGHSLLATRVLSRLKKAVPVSLELRSLFEAPTIRRLAQRIEQELERTPGYSRPALVPQARGESAPLSFAQQRLWFLDQLEPQNTAYLVPGAFNIQGSLNIRALEYSIEALIQRHEILRTTFQVHQGQPVQHVHPTVAFKFPFIDLQGLSPVDRENAVRQLLTQELQHQCNLARGPLLWSCLLHLGAHEHVLLLTMHHIISDGWSNDVMLQDLSLFYKNYNHRQQTQLPSLPIQYADYAIWQRKSLTDNVLEDHLAYWCQQLTGVIPLEMPTDYLRPPLQSYNGALLTEPLPKKLYKHLLDLSQQENVTLFMLLLASFQVLLARYSGQSDISIGTVIANRTQPELEGLIGFFVNTLVLRSDLSGNPSFADLLKHVRSITLDAYAHQEVPFEKLVEVLQPQRDLSRSPLFQIMFGIQQPPEITDMFEGATVRRLNTQHRVAKFDMTFNVVTGAQDLYCEVEYNTDLFEAATIERLLMHWQILLTGIVAHPQAPLASLPLLSPQELTQLSPTWKPAAPFSSLLDLLSQQAQLRPDALALADEQAQLSYAALAHLVSSLALRLQAQGVHPEQVVAVWAQRGLSLQILTLAVLAAGGVYLPLDPSWPLARLQQVLQQSVPVLLLTAQDLPPGLLDLPVVSLSSLWSQLPFPALDAPTGIVHPDQLAYLLFTSGSTGLPKGVAVAHRGLTLLAQAQAERFAVHPQSHVLQFAAPSFDAALAELFVSLQAGARLEIASRDQVRDPTGLARSAGSACHHRGDHPALVAGSASPGGTEQPAQSDCRRRSLFPSHLAACNGLHLALHQCLWTHRSDRLCHVHLLGTGQSHNGSRIAPVFPLVNHCRRSICWFSMPGCSPCPGEWWENSSSEEKAWRVAILTGQT